jgi:putative glutamine amidotransferase
MSLNRPRIAVTPHRVQGENVQRLDIGYTESVLRAGGVPLILPILSDPEALTEVLDLFDGFLLTGSEADVFPELYGKTPPPDNYSDTWRDEQDFAILRHVEATGKPVFGICRGCQVMNVYRGGTLALHYSEIVTTAINHDDDDHNGPPVHQVTLEPSGSLFSLSKEPTTWVNSLHRQVCEHLGRDLRTTALSEDGLIEAIEDSRNPTRFYAVQWHPERSASGPDAFSHALFAQLVHEAAHKAM